MEEIKGTTFFKSITKNMFSDVLAPAESESGVRKILKNFWKKLWAKNVSGLKLCRPITPQDSSGPPTLYIFFWHLKHALQDRLSKSSFPRSGTEPTMSGTKTTTAIRLLVLDYILPLSFAQLHIPNKKLVFSIFRHQGKVGTKWSTVIRVRQAHLPQGLKFFEKNFFIRHLLIVGCVPPSRTFSISLRTQKIASWVQPFQCLPQPAPKSL